MHISLSVETDTLTPEQLRGLSMLLTGITVPSPYQAGPTPGEPEFEFKTEATIKRSEVRLKAGDIVKKATYPSEDLEVTLRENSRIPECIYWAGGNSYTLRWHFHPEITDSCMNITEVNGLKSSRTPRDAAP